MGPGGRPTLPALNGRGRGHHGPLCHPTEDSDNQTKRMAEQGIYSNVNTEVGQIIVATVNTATVDTLTDDVGGTLSKLIRKES